MANERILGTIGTKMKAQGRVCAINKKIEYDKSLGRRGRGIVMYSNLIRQVKLSNGKKYDHMWVVTKEPLVVKEKIGKVVSIEGIVSMYTTLSSAGTTLKSVRLLKIFE